MAIAQTPVEQQQAPESAEHAAQRRWTLIRRIAGAAFIVAFVLYCVFVGVPEDRYGLLVWTVLGLSTQCLGRGWRSFVRIFLDWLPFTAVLIAYDYTRGIADNLGISTHVIAPVHADQWLGHGTMPSVWLQQHLYHPGAPHWWDAAETLIYTSHFVATPVVAFLLYVRNRREWLIFIGRVVALSCAGLVTYVLYPMAPPWFAARHGLMPPVVRISSRGWLELHWQHAGNLLSNAQAQVNDVAAMPSLHTATATLITLYFLPRIRHWWLRILVGCYPLLMGWALVYSGEHYLVDLLFGYLYGLLITVAAVVVRRWWQRRRDGRAALRPATAADHS